MGYIFELEHHQQMILYTEGNEIVGIRLPVRRGGEFLLRTGYLSNLSAVQYRGNIRFVWHSLEHHIILSGTEKVSDRVILSDPVNARLYGGLKLFAREEELWIFYTGKEPADSRFHGYMQKLEAEEGEVRELPETYSFRPVLQPVQLGSSQVLVYGAKGEEKIYRWEGEKLILWKAEDSSVYEEKIQELEGQMICAKEQYEQLRQITMRLQEDGRRMRDYIRDRKKDHRP